MRPDPNVAAELKRIRQVLTVLVELLAHNGRDTVGTDMLVKKVSKIQTPFRG